MSGSQQLTYQRRRDPIAALLSFAVDLEESPEEAEAELRAMGVDVEAFLSRVRADIEAAKKTSLWEGASPTPLELDLLALRARCQNTPCHPGTRFRGWSRLGRAGVCVEPISRPQEDYDRDSWKRLKFCQGRSSHRLCQHRLDEASSAFLALCDVRRLLVVQLPAAGSSVSEQADALLWPFREALLRVDDGDGGDDP